MTQLRVGQAVRIRDSEDLEFAGFFGEIMSMKDEVCGVRITYRPTHAEVADTFIGVFPISEVEAIPEQPNVRA